MDIMHNPNVLVADAARDVLKNPQAQSWAPDEWAKMRARAFSDGNLLQATGITMAQVEVAFGNTDQVDARVLQILSEPGQLSRTDEQWRDLRSAAWTRNDLKEAAALTYAYYLMTFKPSYRATHQYHAH